jgi:hypothetical protein
MGLLLSVNLFFFRSQSLQVFLTTFVDYRLLSFLHMFFISHLTYHYLVVNPQDQFLVWSYKVPYSLLNSCAVTHSLQANFPVEVHPSSLVIRQVVNPPR